MKIAVIVALVLLIGISVYVAVRSHHPSYVALQSFHSAGQPMIQRIELKTEDNVRIIGDYYSAATTSSRGLLLIHMMPATRTSWAEFANKMQAAGWDVLAIDLRGHGESDGGPNGYQNFSDAEHRASHFDVEAGVAFLQSKGIASIALGGASIGANLAIQYLALHPDAKAAFLLSPGLDYRGVLTENAVASLRPGQAVYYVASEDDPASASATQKLFNVTPVGVEKQLTIFKTAGHGTTMFEREPAFANTLALWLEDVSQ